jgi:hypothetical protein
MRLQVGPAVHFIGIDAHRDTLAAAVIDEQGRELAAQTFTTKPDGYREPLWRSSSYVAARPSSSAALGTWHATIGGNSRGRSSVRTRLKSASGT